MAAKKKAAPKRKVATKKKSVARTGRPSRYTEPLAKRLLARLADGESLTSICKDAKMPARSTVWLWREGNGDFSDRYARAIEMGAEKQFDEIEELAASATPETAQVAKLKVDTRKWVLARKMPKKYGEKLTQEISGPDGKPIETKTTTLDPSQLSTQALKELRDARSAQSDE